MEAIAEEYLKILWHTELTWKELIYHGDALFSKPSKMVVINIELT